MPGQLRRLLAILCIALFALNAASIVVPFEVEQIGNGTSPTLALAADGTPHVAFADGTTFYHGIRGGAGWTLQTPKPVNYHPDVQSYTLDYLSLAIDSAGRAHLAFFMFRTDNQRWVEYWPDIDAEGATTIFTSSFGIAEDVELALDATDVPHVAAQFGEQGTDRLRYGYRPLGDTYFTITLLDEDTGGAALALFGASPRITSTLTEDTNPRGLRLWSKSGASWSDATVQSTLTPSSFDLAVDGNDKAHVAYTVAGTGLRYATNSSGSWSNVTYYNGGSITGCAVAVDAQNARHVAFYDAAGDVLRYTGATENNVVDATTGGPQMEIEVDAYGRVHLVYRDAGSGGIYYAISADCNGNGISDSLDIANGTEQDCNGNGIVDICEIAAGFVKDCDANGVPDSCENPNGVQPDYTLLDTTTGPWLINPVSFPAAAWGDIDRDGKLDLVLMGTLADGTYSTAAYRQVFTNQIGELPVDLPDLGKGDLDFGDFDNDGDLDLALTGLLYPSTPTTAIYQNVGYFQFVDIGANLVPAAEGSIDWGDYDNDGDLDLLQLGEYNAYGSHLYRNDAGTFVEVTTSLPALDEATASWGDFEGDGDLDILFMGKIATESMRVAKVYLNDGGSFADAGLGLPLRAGGRVSWADIDGDGDLDILLTGSPGAFIDNSAILYRNDNGTMVDIGAPFRHVGTGSFDWGDFDNDGDVDLLMEGQSGSVFFPPTIQRTEIYRNDGGNFVDSGLYLNEGNSGVAMWGDYDRDGDLDVFFAGGNIVAATLATTIHLAGCLLPNEAPSPPSGLSLQVDGDAHTFSWLPGSDAETTGGGLSYNLQVGSFPGGGDYLSATSVVVDGRRVLPESGNVGSGLGHTLILPGAGPVYWQVQTIDAGFLGSSFAVAAPVTAPVAGRSTLLSAASPFVRRTEFLFELMAPAEVRLELFSLSGRRVAILLDGVRLESGSHAIPWSMRDDNGVPIAGGVYFYRAQIGATVVTGRVVALR